MGKSFRQNLSDFADSTTIHGVNDLVNSESCAMRVIWGMVTLCSLAMLAYMLYLVVYQWQMSPISYQSSVIPDDQFPTIRIYAQNFVNYSTTTITSVEASKGGEGALKKAFPYYFYVGYFYKWVFLTDDAVGVITKAGINSQNQLLNQLLRKEFENMETNMSGITEHTQKVMFQPDELLAFNYSDGSYNISVIPEIDEFGVSYVIDAARNNNTAESMKEANRHAASMQFGVKNLVRLPPMVPHAQLAQPTGMIPSPTGYIITFGSELCDNSSWVIPKMNMVYRVLVSPVKRKMISTKRNPCQANGISVRKCLQQCDILLDSCTWDCDWFPRRSNPPKKICNQFLIKGDVLDQDRQSRCREMTKSCSKKCLKPCEVWEYKLQIMEGEFVDPNVTILNSINPSNLQSSDIDLARSGINPATGTPTTQAAQSPLPNTNLFVVTIVNGWRASFVEEYYVYTWSSLLSNIGGLVGLFVGASIISLFHVIFFWCFKTRAKNMIEAIEVHI